MPRQADALVTSGQWLARGTIPQSCPADRRLKTASGPAARTAAIHRPCTESGRNPTA